MPHSAGVTSETDHVVLWGLGQAYAWVGCPAQDIPFPNFSIVIEASGDSAEEQMSNGSGRWPVVGVAINDSGHVLASAEVTSGDRAEFSLGEVAVSDSDSMLYFVFMNDYFNRRTGEDVNLRIRRIRFIRQPPSAGRVIVSWDANSESDLAGYRVYYGATSRDYTQNVDVGNVTFHRLEGLQTGRKYYFALMATDSLFSYLKYEYDFANGNIQSLLALLF